MSLNTDHFARCIQTLDSSLDLYNHAKPDSIEQEVFRNAIVKGFELNQEIALKLIQRALKEFGHSGKKLNATPVKDLLRLATAHGLMSPDEVEHWFSYRDNRNTTAHEYGAEFAHETMNLLPGFLKDARNLESILEPSSRKPNDAMTTQAKLTLDLPPRYLEMVEAILRQHVPNAEVWAYGSRVTGGAYHGSDLDLVVRQPNNLDSETPGITPLRAGLSESNIPIRVEVLDWARLPDSFRREISNNYVTIKKFESND